MGIWDDFYTFIGSPKKWENLRTQYNFSEKVALQYHGNPIDRLENPVSQKVQIFSVVGDADEVVPVRKIRRW